MKGKEGILKHHTKCNRIKRSSDPSDRVAGQRVYGYLGSLVDLTLPTASRSMPAKGERRHALQQGLRWAIEARWNAGDRPSEGRRKVGAEK